jgi:hypothetical protein
MCGRKFLTEKKIGKNGLPGGLQKKDKSNFFKGDQLDILKTGQIMFFQKRAIFYMYGRKI